MEEEPNPLTVLSQDPFTITTRKHRTYLLALSSAGAIVFYTGTLPVKIEGLGITLEAPDRGTLVGFLGIAISYFLISFAIYAAADYSSWSGRVRSAFIAAKDSPKWKVLLEEALDDAAKSILPWIPPNIQVWAMRRTPFLSIFEYLRRWNLKSKAAKIAASRQTSEQAPMAIAFRVSPAMAARVLLEIWAPVVWGHLVYMPIRTMGPDAALNR